MRKRGFFFFVLTIIVFYLFTNVVASGNSEDGLLGYWSFDEVNPGGRVIYSEDFEGCKGALPEGWSGDDVLVSAERAFSGKYSIKLAENASVRSPKVPVKEGVYYSVLVKSFNRGDFRKYGASQVELEFWDAEGSLLSTSKTLFDLLDPVDPQWREVAANGVAPAKAEYATLKISVQDYQDKPGVSFHDDIKIVEATTINDNSGNGRLGVVVGEVQLIDGRCGQALLFNGEDSYVEIPLSDGLRSPDAISIEAWIYPIPIYQLASGGIMVNLNGVGGRDAKRWLIRDDGTLVAQLYGYSADAFAGPKLASNTWTHVVYVYDGEEQAFYINGVKEKYAPGPSSGRMPSGYAPLKIGWGHDTYHNVFHFRGAMDEVKVYGRAFSSQEIAEKYSQFPQGDNGGANFANAFSGRGIVKIPYSVKGQCDVELIVYDEWGYEILLRKESNVKAGDYDMEWDLRDENRAPVLPGLYLAMVSTKEGLARGLLVKVL